MILTVTLNTALDRTASVPNFRIGQRHRAVESRLAAGGKGVNIARALRTLDCPVIAAGLAGGTVGARIRGMLDAEGVISDFVEVAGESRINLTVVDPTDGVHTEVNERGPTIGSADLERLTNRIGYLASGASLAILAGSIPPGADALAYAELVSCLAEHGVPSLLDTDGEPMRLGLTAGPAIVAPNQIEAEEAVGHEFADIDDMAAGLDELVEMGAREAIITFESGCVASLRTGGERTIFKATTPPLDPVARVGSGDAFVAGFASARFKGLAPQECLAWGVACGAESTQHFGAGFIDPAEVERIAGEVDVEAVGARV